MKTIVRIIAIGAFAMYAGGCDLFGKDQPQPHQVQPGMPAFPGQQVQPGMPMPPGQQVQPGMPMPPGQQVQPGMPVAPGQQAVPGSPAIAEPAAPPQPAPAPPMPTGDQVTDRLNTAKFNRAADWKSTSGLERLPAARGERRGWEVVLPGPPFCHTYIAVSDDGIEEFAVNVESPAETTEGEAAWPAVPGDTTRTAIISNHCPATPGSYKLFFENRKGAGTFALQVFSKAN